LAAAAAGLVALGLASVGLYLGLKQDKAAKMPSYSVRYAIAQNQTNSSVSLATTTTPT